MPARPQNLYAYYHAHVYFGPQTVAMARTLCEEAARRFDVRMGRVHEREVGPHPQWSCQLSFDAAAFDPVIGWLDENRKGLDILVHGDTGDDLLDHTEHAAWLGNEHPLKLDMFRR